MPALFPPTVKTQVYPGSLTTLADGRLVHAWNVWFAADEKVKVRIAGESHVMTLAQYVILANFYAARSKNQNAIDNILKWSSLKPDTQRKLLWDNAARFYKQA